MDRTMKVCCRLTALAVSVLAACGGSVASVYVKSQTVDSSGATITVQSSDDPNLAGTSIMVPAGALTTPVTIQIAPSDDPVAPSGTKAAGPVVEFLPDGLTFAVPVTITIPLTNADPTLSDTFIEAVESDGSSRMIRIQSISNGLATFQTSGFTRFGGYWAIPDGGASCATDSDCPNGQACVNGECATQSTTSPDAGQPDSGIACNTDADCGPCDCQNANSVCGTCVNGQCVAAMTCGWPDGGSDAGVDAGQSDAGQSDAGSDAGISCASDSDCPNGNLCINGQCTSSASSGSDGGSDGGSCDAGQNLCSGSCTNLMTDPSNCGACSTQCASGQCSAGMCSSPDGGTSCQTNSDCANGQTCVNGTCSGEACQSDADCPNGLSCYAGQCV